MFLITLWDILKWTCTINNQVKLSIFITPQPEQISIMSDFYEKNYQQYFESTVNLDPSTFLTPLASRLKPNATIFDIGCGSGRDMLWFAKKGFQPTGLEQSHNLACLAQKHTDCQVIKGDFNNYDFSKHSFSALVLVGSLVHVSKESLPTILMSVCQALELNGLVMITLKEGAGYRTSSDGRIFTLWSKQDIEKIFKDNSLTILDFSRQKSKLRPDDIWLGYVLRFN